MILLIFFVIFIFAPLFIVSKLKMHGHVLTFGILLLNLFGWGIVFLVLNPIISGNLFDNYSLMVNTGLGQFIILLVGTTYQIGYVYWIYRYWN
jgi:hypothetical protein